MTDSEVLDKLAARFPQDAHYTRKGAFGKDLTYLSTSTVIYRLNSIGRAWDWFIKEMIWQPDMLVVRGTLHIEGLGSRDGIGIQELSEKRGGDLVKGASSDALKKAATLFGVGLYLAGPDYESDAPTATPEAFQTRPGDPWGKPPPRQPAVATPTRPQPSMEPEEAYDLWSSATKRLAASDVDLLMKHRYGVWDVSELDSDQVPDFEYLVSAMPDEEMTALLENYETLSTA